MPYRIRKRDDKFQVVNTDTGMPKGEHETRKEAIRQMRTLYQAEQSMGKSLNKVHRLRVDEIASHAQAILDHIEAMKPDEIAEFEGDLSEPDGDTVKSDKDMDAEKAISKREDVNPERGKSEYGDVKFADDKNKKYPIDNEEHIRAAWNYIAHPDNAARYSPGDVDVIKNRIIAAWKEKIDKDGPPSEQEKEKKSYLKSIGVSEDKWAVKFVAKDQIKGYSHLWGHPEKTDIEIEYFSRKTDFWDEFLGKSPRPLTWDHAQDEDFKNAPVVIGSITDFGDDDVGRWYIAKLDRSNKYNKAIAELIKQGRLGTSSDSAPQYVERVKTGKATWLKTWPFFAAALTDTPCEPRMIGSIEQLKALGVRLPTATDAETSRKIKYEKAKRERKLLELQTKKE